MTSCQRYIVAQGPSAKHHIYMYLFYPTKAYSAAVEWVKNWSVKWHFANFFSGVIGAGPHVAWLLFPTHTANKG